MKIANQLPTLFCLALLAAQNFARAEDAYYRLPLASLKFTEGALPEEGAGASGRNWQRLPFMQPRAVMDGAAEAYVSEANQSPWEPLDSQATTLSLRAPQGREITGRLFVPQTNLNGMVELKFKVAPAQAAPEAKAAFFQAKESYYRRLQDRNLPGAAWFRHQAQAAAGLAGRTNSDDADLLAGQRRGRESELEDSYDLFSGGRALSENLQLDRALPATKTAEETLDITNVAGITVKEMNWKELIQGAKPALDPLAAFIPADQHAVFFPSFQAMVQMIDEADANGTPILQLLEPRAEDANCRARYQKQLCLGLGEVSRLLGPQVVASVAFTGSDPFLRVGTDVAVLFEARNPDLLKTYLAAQQKAMQAANHDVKAVTGELAGVSYSGMVSPDRSVCSYLASVSNVVFVCNSRTQLETLLQVARGGAAPLSSQDEYVFFRQRYPRTDQGETAFVVLTDATIRRWCGPRSRIADSRRTRAGGVLAELQAAHLSELASGQATDAVLATDFSLPDAGEFRLTPAGVISATYGSLNFITPIAEIPLARITKAEADGYQRWRENYQRNWQQFFDPLAVRFSIAADRLGAELTVTPLIAATEYRQFINLSTGAQIAPDAGDPHTNTLLHLVLAINAQSQPVQDAGNLVGTMAPGLKVSPFGWLGQSIALYADEDPFWDRLKQATNTDLFLEQHYADLPVALHCEVKNPLGLAAFLAALHGFVDQSAPRMTTWQNLEHHGQPYVKVVATAPGMSGEANETAIYYAATPRALIVTLNEPLLKRALDRQAAAGAPEGKASPAAAGPWLGKSLCAAATARFLEVVQALARDSYQAHLQALAWNNLPILNEWKRLYPDQDPVQLHEQLWGTRLLCPGGGTYVWNEKWQTMESTVFGHPGEPKTSSTKALAQILSSQLGLTFENQGLSAQALLKRNPGR